MPRCWIFFSPRWMNSKFLSRFGEALQNADPCLTAVDAVPQSLDMGADDYLVKPFFLEILLARGGAIARRVQRSSHRKRAPEVSHLIETAVWRSVSAKRDRPYSEAVGTA